MYRLSLAIVTVTAQIAVLSVQAPPLGQLPGDAGTPSMQTVHVLSKPWAIVRNGRREDFSSIFEIVIAPFATSSACQLNYQMGYVHTRRSQPAGLRLGTNGVRATFDKIGAADVVEVYVFDSRSSTLKAPCNRNNLMDAEWDEKQSWIRSLTNRAQAAFAAFLEAERRACGEQCRVVVE